MCEEKENAMKMVHDINIYVYMHYMKNKHSVSSHCELENNYNCQISICFQTIHWCGKWVKRIKTSSIAQWRLSKCKASMILYELQQIHRKCPQLWFCQAWHNTELASVNICNENMLFFSKASGVYGCCFFPSFSPLFM